MLRKDIYGKGLLAYYNGKKNAVFSVESDIAETEEWPIEVFFRDYEDMPYAEKTALSKAEGHILDIGAGAGSHALWLQQQGKSVTAIDISPGAVEVMKKRGVKNVLLQDFFTYQHEKYDTLLLLMNGGGIAGKLEHLTHFFQHAKQFLNPGGKILLDSSDLIYLYMDEEDGSIMLDLNDDYYGEISYTFCFESEKDESFDWLFVDFDTLSRYAKEAGFYCEKIYEDDHYLYLAELILK